MCFSEAMRKISNALFRSKGGIKMLNITEKVLLCIGIISLVICCVWVFIIDNTISIWFPLGITIYNLLFGIYLIIKKKRERDKMFRGK